MNFQKTLYLLCLVFLGDLIQNIKCAGVDDNEITEYQEPVNTKQGVSLYYDYKGYCSNQGGMCTTANACEIKAEKCDVCPQSSQDVVCCKKLTIEVQSCESQHDQCSDDCGNGPQRNVDDCPKSKKSIRGVKIYEKERLCALVGGSCVQKHDCYPDELTSVKGLCPKNKYLGVECCYHVKLPKKNNSCEEDFYGACMDRCHPLLRRPANDCGEGESCCVLVN